MGQLYLCSQVLLVTPRGVRPAAPAVPHTTSSQDGEIWRGLITTSDVENVTQGQGVPDHQVSPISGAQHVPRGTGGGGGHCVPGRTAWARMLQRPTGVGLGVRGGPRLPCDVRQEEAATVTSSRPLEREAFHDGDMVDLPPAVFLLLMTCFGCSRWLVYLSGERAKGLFCGSEANIAPAARHRSIHLPALVEAWPTIIPLAVRFRVLVRGGEGGYLSLISTSGTVSMLVCLDWRKCRAHAVTCDVALTDLQWVFAKALVQSSKDPFACLKLGLDLFRCGWFGMGASSESQTTSTHTHSAISQFTSARHKHAYSTHTAPSRRSGEHTKWGLGVAAAGAEAQTTWALGADHCPECVRRVHAACGFAARKMPVVGVLAGDGARRICGNGPECTNQHHTACTSTTPRTAPQHCGHHHSTPCTTTGTTPHATLQDRKHLNDHMHCQITDAALGGGGGVGMTPWCVLVCSRQRQLADRHLLPFPWTLSLCRRWYPSASHRSVSFLFLLALSFLLYSPFLSLGRLCQRSPWTVPVSLPGVESTRRRAAALAVGQGRPNGRLRPGGGGPPPQRRLLGPGMSTCGATSPTGARNNLPPAHSRAQSSLWRAHQGGYNTTACTTTTLNAVVPSRGVTPVARGRRPNRVSRPVQTCVGRVAYHMCIIIQFLWTVLHGT